MATATQSLRASAAAAEQSLFTKRTLATFNPRYDVTSDASQIIVTDRMVDEQPSVIQVVHDWFEEFCRRK